MEFCGYGIPFLIQKDTDIQVCIQCGGFVQNICFESQLYEFKPFFSGPIFSQGSGFHSLIQTGFHQSAKIRKRKTHKRPDGRYGEYNAADHPDNSFQRAFPNEGTNHTANQCRCGDMNYPSPQLLHYPTPFIKQTVLISSIIHWAAVIPRSSPRAVENPSRTLQICFPPKIPHRAAVNFRIR